MMAFDLIQRSILQLGYQLFYSSRDRIGNAVAAGIRRFYQKTQATTNGNEKQNRLKAETWLKLAIDPEEIQRTPNDVIMAQLIQQNGKLSTTVKERASDLYDDWDAKLKNRETHNTIVSSDQLGETKSNCWSFRHVCRLHESESLKNS